MQNLRRIFFSRTKIVLAMDLGNGDAFLTEGKSIIFQSRSPKNNWVICIYLPSKE